MSNPNNRGAKRREEKKRRHRMAQNGGLVVPGRGPAQMPPVNMLLMQLLEQNQLLITLAETQCRLLLKQTPEEIKATQGISFPIKTGPTKQELIDALQEEMDRLATEEGDELTDAVGEPVELSEERAEQLKLAFIETEEEADALEVETSDEQSGETGEDHDTSLD